MSLKKRILLIAIMVLLISGGIFSYVATHIEGRSTMSKIAEIVLWIVNDRKADEQAVREHLDYAAENNTKPYVMPSGIFIDTTFSLDEFQGMQVVYANIDTDNNNDNDQPYILYLHGGSYISQPTNVHWAFLDELIKGTNAAVIAPIYPKAPTHQFEEAYDLLIALYRQISENIETTRINLIGDSAGGGLALGLAEHLLHEQLPQPGNIILISPWLDLTLRNPDIIDYESIDPMLNEYSLREIGKTWAGGHNRRDYRLSPLFGQLKGLAPTALFVGTHEIFLPDARLFRDKAEAAGLELQYYEYPRMNHIFPLYPIPEAKQAQQQMINIINGD